jgi:hypothetical protein
MSNLTNSASGFIVVIGMRVRNDLNEKQQGEQRKRER